jgi:hypothetical protein
MSYEVVELHNNSYKPIINTALVRKIQTRGSGEPVSLT